MRVTEEHGFVRGGAVDKLWVSGRVLFTPAHVCPVVNLTDQVVAAEKGRAAETWKVDERGRTQ